MSGRPPPPWPPTASTALRTRSTALKRSVRSSVTPTATVARPPSTEMIAATPVPIERFFSSTRLRSSLGSKSLSSSGVKKTSPTFSGPVASLAVPISGEPVVRSCAERAIVFFASASSRSSRRRSSTSAATRAGTSSGEALSEAAASLSLSSRAVSQARAASPVSASIRRTPEATALSEVILSSWMSPSALTWVPPQSSTEYARSSSSPIERTRTSSPYFSPNRAIAPDEIASSMLIRRVPTGRFSRMWRLTSASTVSISSRVIGLLCEKSKRK